LWLAACGTNFCTCGRERILVAHNAHQKRGGKESVVEAEVALMRAADYGVREYRRHNAELAGMRTHRVFRLTLGSMRAPAFTAALARAGSSSLRRRLDDDNEHGRLLLLAAALRQVGAGGTVMLRHRAATGCAIFVLCSVRTATTC